jgi:hypothetical protein
MLIYLKEHFPFYWKMYAIIFARACGFSTIVPIPPFHTNCVTGWTTIFQTHGSTMGSNRLASMFSWYEPILIFLIAMHERKCLCYGSTKDCDDLINHILEAVADIRDQPRQQVRVRACIWCRCEAWIHGSIEATLSSEEIHRTVCKSPIHLCKT